MCCVDVAMVDVCMYGCMGVPLWDAFSYTYMYIHIHIPAQHKQRPEHNTPTLPSPSYTHT